LADTRAVTRADVSRVFVFTLASYQASRWRSVWAVSRTNLAQVSVGALIFCRVVASVATALLTFLTEDSVVKALVKIFVEALRRTANNAYTFGCLTEVTIDANIGLWIVASTIADSFVTSAHQTTSVARILSLVKALRLAIDFTDGFCNLAHHGVVVTCV